MTSTSRFQRCHYELLAKLFGRHWHDGLDLIWKELIAELKQDNPAFDEERFRAAALDWWEESKRQGYRVQRGWTHVTFR